jgi:sugar phosphate isomerase/epimerase
VKVLKRREFIRKSAVAGLAANSLWVASKSFAGDPASTTPARKMTMDLVCGNIGISANQVEAVELAGKFGFESVGVDAGYFASLNPNQLSEFKSALKAKNLVLGAAGLPLEFRRDQATFEASLKKIPVFAASLECAGAHRAATWLTPCHESLPYLENLRQHVTRLREAAKILGDHGIRLGLEYVGPKTSWASRRYTFIHTLAEMKDLIAEINAANVGVVLDSWHWYHAGDSVSDLLTLKNSDVIAVDLNDAPAGIPKDQQVDNHRELPCSTGVIDLAGFLNGLNQIGYDGPVRVEPFNQAVNKMPKDESCRATSDSLKKAFALIR